MIHGVLTEPTVPIQPLNFLGQKRGARLEGDDDDYDVGLLSDSAIF